MRACLSVFALLFLGMGIGASRAANAEPMSVQVMVVCHDASMAKRLSDALVAALARDHYATHGSPWPDVRLVVYAMPTVGNSKNPHGWSIAVAHAVVSPLLMAVPALLKSKQTLPGLMPGPQLAAVFMHSTGILTYLSVLNVEHFDDHNFPLVIGAIINAFTARWSPVIGRRVTPKPLPQIGSSFRRPPAVAGSEPPAPGP